MNPTWIVLEGPRCGLKPSQPDYAFPEAVALEMVNRWTSAGDWVLDPFLGYGTTADVCSKEGRNCLGIEIDKNKASKARSKFKYPSRIIVGDAQLITLEKVPPIKLVLTSAPFFHHISDHDQAISTYTSTILNMLERQKGIMSKEVVIAVETVFLKRSDGVVRNFTAALSTAMHCDYREVDQTIFVCGARERTIFGMDHFVVQQFTMRK